MIVCITGHTSGIGKAYFDQCKNRGFYVRGYSRATGYDIQDQTVQKRIVEESQDCNIFINNAHAGFSQTELFSRCWSAWKNCSKIIICTGSHVTLKRLHPSGKQHELGAAHYAAQKAALEMAVNWAWNEDTGCHVVLVRPSLTATPRSENMLDQLSKQIPIDPDKLASFVLYSILDTDLCVRELTVAARKQNA